MPTEFCSRTGQLRPVAVTQQQIAVSPRVCHVDGAWVSKRALCGGQSWNDGDADTGCHRGTNCVGAGHMGPVAGAKAEGPGLATQVFLQRISLSEPRGKGNPDMR